MLAALERGAGHENVLLLHGFLGSGRNLFGFAGRLCDGNPRLHCRLPDLLGHGASPALPEFPDLEDLAFSVLDFLDKVGWHDPVSAIGHSLGGRVLLAMAKLAPHRLGRTLLLDIAPGPVDQRSADLQPILNLVMSAASAVPTRDEMRNWFKDQGVSPALSEWLIMNLSARPEGGYEWRFDRERLAELNEASSGTDLWDAFETIADRVTCVRGGRSTFVTEADVIRARQLGVVTHTLPEAGHFVHVDAPEELASFALNWLR